MRRFGSSQVESAPPESQCPPIERVRNIGASMFGLSKRETLTALAIILIGAAVATWAITVLKI